MTKKAGPKSCFTRHIGIDSLPTKILYNKADNDYR